MEYEIKRINSWSIIKIVFIISFLIGLFIGVIYSFTINIIGNILLQLTFDELIVEPLSAISIFFLIIIIALFTSILSGSVTFVFVIIYNLTAQWIGGIKVELKFNENVNS